MNTENTVFNTEENTNNSLSRETLEKIAALSLRDNMLLILSSEDRYFSIDELYEASVKLKLSKGEAPSQRGFKICLSRLSSSERQNSLFNTDITGYWYGLKSKNLGDFPEVPLSKINVKTHKEPKSSEPTKKGVQGRPSKDALTEYVKLTQSVLGGRAVPEARVRVARQTLATNLASVLGGDFTSEKIVEILAKNEEMLENQLAQTPEDDQNDDPNSEVI
jgi:hypothetical protein